MIITCSPLCHQLRVGLKYESLSAARGAEVGQDDACITEAVIEASVGAVARQREIHGGTPRRHYLSVGLHDQG